MPSRFSSGVYDPALVKVMGEALEGAWSQVHPQPRNVDLARQVLAGAIIEAVDAGERGSEVLIAAAAVALEAAMESSILKTALGKPPGGSGAAERSVNLNASNDE
jgi:hypothetical protein